MATTAAEVEQIVVRLSGDAKQYVRTMEDAQGATKGISDAVHKIDRDIDGFGQALSRFGHAAVAGYGLYKLEGILHQAFDAFSEAETIGARLTATMEANGRAVDELTDQYKEFAEQQEQLFIVEDDHVLSLLRMAETFEITGTAAQKAVQDALALEAVTGGTADSLIRLTAAMAKGDIDQAMRFARMVPQLRGIRDQTEFVAKAQHLVASGTRAANAEMETGAGLLKMLDRDYRNLLEDLGEVISDVIKPLVKGLREVIAWVRQLDPEVKRMSANIILVTAALLSLGPAIASFRATGLPALRMMADGFQIIYGAIMYLFKPVATLIAIWTGLGTVVAAVFSPWGIAIAAAAVAIGVFITRMGGIAKALEAVKDFAVDTWQTISEYAVIAWDYIMEKATQFINWVTPIWRAFSQLATTAWQTVVQIATAAWELIKTAATIAGDWIVATWEYITGGAQVNWDQVRKYIMMAIIGAEYILLNFGKIVKLTWAGIKYGAVAMANFLLNNIFLVMLGPAGWLTLLLRNLNVDWQAVWRAMAQFTGRIFAQLATAAGRLGNVIMRALRGLRTEDGLSGLFSALEGIEVTFSGINVPSLNRLEEQLRQEFLALGTAVAEDFNTFYLRRLAEIGLTPQEASAYRRRGEQMGGQIAMGMGRPLDRLNAALFGSMEAFSRVIEYQERIQNRRQVPTPRIEGEATSVIAPILRTSEEHLRRIAGRPPVRIGEADLG